jgi:hypothetical protein
MIFPFMFHISTLVQYKNFPLHITLRQNVTYEAGSQLLKILSVGNVRETLLCVNIQRLYVNCIHKCNHRNLKHCVLT